MILKKKLSRATLAAAKQFDAARAARTLENLWQQVRLMDSEAVQRGAEALAAELRAAGVLNVRIEQLPADGVTSAAGWLSPVTWTVSEARLETIGEKTDILADYSKIPQNIAQFCPPTTGNDWVEGAVVSLLEGFSASAANADVIAEKWRGHFLLLPPGAASIELNQLAAEHGVLALLATSPGPLPDAARWLNYAVPLAAGAPCVPVFSLTPATATHLRARLASTPALRLRGLVRATRGTGTLPLVTGVVGGGSGAPILVCGHMDEPGANDNASGCATAVEALRILQALANDPAAQAQQRPIHFFFSMELRGMQLWLNSSAHQTYFVSSLNLDMTGADPKREPCTLRIGGGFAHRPHFGRRVLAEALDIADRVVKNPCERKPGNCVMGDSGVMGVHDLEGSVSIEQKTGPSYHTNADTPARIISAKMLRWSGAATTSYLYLMSRFDNADFATMAGEIRDEAVAALAAGQPDDIKAARRAFVELAAIKRALLQPTLYGTWATPAELYAAGVNRRTGLWPAVAEDERVHAATSVVRKALAALPSAPVVAPDAIRQEADRLVPQALFRGALAFEDQWKPEARKKLRDALGLEVGWGTENWAWQVATCFRGRQTLSEIVDELALIGVNVDLAKAVKLTHFLIELGKVRLRPVITAAEFRAALEQVGVKRGSILMVHAGLSRFGYVQGGPAMIVDTLRDVLGPDGTLVMATHSNNVLGVAPYNPQTSPSNVGAVTEYFRRLPGVVRSPHPTHSVAAIGPAAVELTRTHLPSRTPLSRKGFWGRLYDMNGDVLLLCPIHSSTIFHVGEDWNNLPQPTLIAHVETAPGKRRTYTLPHGSPWHSNHFEPLMAAPLLAQGVMHEAKMGEASIYLGPARAMADISVEANRANPACSIRRGGTCTCFYCAYLRQGLEARKR
jgi:aminoglycoside 3-N-acetyltransferase